MVVPFEFLDRTPMTIQKKATEQYFHFLVVVLQNCGNLVFLSWLNRQKFNVKKLFSIWLRKVKYIKINVLCTARQLIEIPLQEYNQTEWNKSLLF